MLSIVHRLRSGRVATRAQAAEALMQLLADPAACAAAIEAGAAHAPAQLLNGGNTAAARGVPLQRLAKSKRMPP